MSALSCLDRPVQEEEEEKEEQESLVLKLGVESSVYGENPGGEFDVAGFLLEIRGLISRALHGKSRSAGTNSR